MGTYRRLVMGSVMTGLMVISFIVVAACDEMKHSRTGKRQEIRREKIRNIQYEYASGMLNHGGYDRTYYLHTPSSYNPENPTPLVLAFHGGWGLGNKFAKVSGLNDLADREGFIVVYPDGIDGHWNDGREVPIVHPEIDDVSFVAELITHLESIRNIDSRRIYATGISNGGMFTQRLACELSDRIAAFAPVSSALPIPMKAKCRPRRSVPILLINGQDDQLIHWSGGKIWQGTGGEIGETISVPQTVEFWRQHNSCSASATVEQLPDGDPFDGTLVEAFRYSGCQREAVVVFLSIRGGGHGWPGSTWRLRYRESLSGKISQDINASQVVWNFFQPHALP